MIMSLKMALRSIAGNKMRAVLTMLGIIIGVMALVVLVSLVRGATSSVTDSVSGLGSNLITVSVSDSKGQPVSLSTLDDWVKSESVFGAAAPYASESVTGKCGSEYGSVTVYGTNEAYLDIRNLSLQLGRWISGVDLENGSYVCVVNENAAEQLVGYVDCVGKEIRLNGVPFTVIGVLDDDSSSSGMFSSGSMSAYIPYPSLIKLSSSIPEEVTSFYAAAAAGVELDAAAERMDALLYERFAEDEDAYSVTSQNALEEAMGSITAVLEALLGGIAAISLVVGGIGIMNIMLVTVTERTREIGIRKAIGASRRDILTQFLMESVVLCMMGCALGIFFSWAVLQIVNTIVSGLSLRFDLSFSVVLIAVAFCFLIGALFGLYPANKAAKMKPIDALHYGG